MPSRLGAAWWLRRSEHHEVSPTITSPATVADRQSLGHILQVCPRTHASRIARHHKNVDLVEQRAVRLGYGVKQEPAIPTPAGIRKPNLVLDHSECVTILDVTIVADNADLDKCHNNKCLYYDQPAIRESAQRYYGPRSVSFEALAMNWRGLSQKICCLAQRTGTERFVLESHKFCDS